MADSTRDVTQNTKPGNVSKPVREPAGKPAAAPAAKPNGSHADTFKDELIATIPHLRAFARSLCHDASQADDLAQEALAKAWKARDSFEPGTSIKAWTFMILRNQFYSEKRRSWRSTPLDAEMAENTLVANDNPSAPMELLELRAAMAKLPDDQREALILVGAGGMAYDEAARVCGVAVGTIKSRVSRARKALETILDAGSTRRSEGQDIRAGEAFNDILGQVDALSEGGVQARGDD
jgi:RNA polymerase sigma-70 factor (ECF subfamily)